MSRLSFYKKNVLENLTDKKSKILVLGAGDLDINLFNDLGYENVTFSNFNLNVLDVKDQKKFKTFLLQDIKLDSNSFDYCVAHACIHHSSKPHNSILEMFRVASKGMLVIEANDCLLTRLACKIGFSEEYERSAIKKNKHFGGVDNTDVANFVFRWTEREVYKLISSYKPDKKHSIKFSYSFDIKFTKNILIHIFFKIFFKIFKKQQNLISFFISK